MPTAWGRVSLRAFKSVALTALFLIALCQPGRAEDWPAYLPAWFTAAFTVDGVAVRPISHQEKDGIHRVVAESKDAAVRVTVDYRPCDPGVCERILQSGRQYLNTSASRRQGRLLWVTDTDLRAVWADGGAREENFMFRIPGAITAWIVVRHKPEPEDTDPFATRLLGWINRWRAENLARASDSQASEGGLAGWSAALWARARDLHAGGDTAGALALLRRLVDSAADAPADPGMRLDLAEWETDPQAARAQARKVLDQAEDPALAARAARVLGISLPTLDSLPVLQAEPDAKGPRLVLLALPPADARLLEDAAQAYQKATGIPVQLARLPTPIDLGKPERFLGQLQVEQEIARRRQKTIDFTGWDRERYIAELHTVTAREDALTRFMYHRAAAILPDRPAQYDSGPVLDRLRQAIAGLRAPDRRVMYVGVTEAGLFRGDALYLSTDVRVGANAAGLLSYSAMEASSLEEPVQSRPRLIARLAKELVIASLAQLDIPRPTDPADPYAEGASLEDLDRKTLTLSAPTRAAIEALR